MDYRVRLSVEISKWLTEIARNEGTTPHQLVQRWAMQHLRKKNWLAKENKIELSAKLSGWLMKIAKDRNISIPQLIVRAVNRDVQVIDCLKRLESVPATYASPADEQKAKAEQANPDPWSQGA